MLPTLLIYITLTAVYGDNCNKLVGYTKQTDKDVQFLRTREIIGNFSASSYCKSEEDHSVCCVMACTHHHATVCATHGHICLVHNYSITGEFVMRTVDDVWITNGLKFINGKGPFIKR